MESVKADFPAAVSATRSAVAVRKLDDGALVRATIESDEVAWREMMRRYTAPLRDAIRDASEEISEPEVDDVMGELWLSLIEQGMRRLRTFDPSRGATLLAWLTIRASQLVHGRHARRQAAPPTISLEEAPELADPTPPPIPQLDNKTLLRVEEVARRWGLDRKTIYGMIERGQISARRCGRLVRIPIKVVESFESQASVAPERHIRCR